MSLSSSWCRSRTSIASLYSTKPLRNRRTRQYTAVDIVLRGQEDRVEVEKDCTGFFALSDILKLILQIFQHRWPLLPEILFSRSEGEMWFIYTSFIYHNVVSAFEGLVSLDSDDSWRLSNICACMACILKACASDSSFVCILPKKISTVALQWIYSSILYIKKQDFFSFPSS